MLAFNGRLARFRARFVARFSWGVVFNAFAPTFRALFRIWLARSNEGFTCLRQCRPGGRNHRQFGRRRGCARRSRIVSIAAWYRPSFGLRCWLCVLISICVPAVATIIWIPPRTIRPRPIRQLVAASSGGITSGRIVTPEITAVKDARTPQLIIQSNSRSTLSCTGRTVREIYSRDANLARLSRCPR